jgi:hypothetical protein
MSLERNEIFGFLGPDLAYSRLSPGNTTGLILTNVLLNIILIFRYLKIRFNHMKITYLKEVILINRTTRKPGDPSSPETIQEVQALFIQLFDHLIDAVKE